MALLAQTPAGRTSGGLGDDVDTVLVVGADFVPAQVSTHDYAGGFFSDSQQRIAGIGARAKLIFGIPGVGRFNLAYNGRSLYALGTARLKTNSDSSARKEEATSQQHHLKFNYVFKKEFGVGPACSFVNYNRGGLPGGVETWNNRFLTCGLDIDGYHKFGDAFMLDYSAGGEYGNRFEKIAIRSNRIVSGIPISALTTKETHNPAYLISAGGGLTWWYKGTLGFRFGGSYITLRGPVQNVPGRKLVSGFPSAELGVTKVF